VSRLPVEGRLAVLEEPDRVLVVLEAEPADWVCAFAKADAFPARRWAERMVHAYNERLELSCGASPRRPAASGP
jgi:hypothetical protein